jgi:hypothetical protein
MHGTYTLGFNKKRHVERKIIKDSDPLCSKKLDVQSLKKVKTLFYVHI